MPAGPYRDRGSPRLIEAFIAVADIVRPLRDRPALNLVAQREAAAAQTT